MNVRLLQQWKKQSLIKRALGDDVALRNDWTYRARRYDVYCEQTLMR